LSCLVLRRLHQQLQLHSLFLAAFDWLAHWDAGFREGMGMVMVMASKAYLLTKREK